ncbi:MAG: ThiF family adenylyltransferase [Promethearchaeota archaeon]
MTENSDFEYKFLGEDDINDDKYDRQKRIAGWDQNKISNATVMIIGVGATGNEVAKNLSLSGIGKLILIDYDIIEKSNLNRCILFNMENKVENKYKVDIIKAACEKLNPEVKILTIKKALNEIDKDLYRQVDAICSCLDNIEARLEANNYAYYYRVPFIDSGIEEFFGSVQAVYSGVEDAACLQCGISGSDLDLMWLKFSCTGEEIESTNGATIGKIATIITTTSIIGGIQTQQVIKFLLGIDQFKEQGKWNPHIGEPLIGKQLNYNGIINKFEIIEKLKNPDCWTCSYQDNK